MTTEGMMEDLPGIPTLALSISPVKHFRFTWTPVPGADFYRLEQSIATADPFTVLGTGLLGDSASHAMPLHLLDGTRLRVQACNTTGCTSSAPKAVVGPLAEAVGYIKASNTGPNDAFGYHVAMSGDGQTLAVGASWEDSNSTGVDGDESNNSAEDSGAVYIFTQQNVGQWVQQSYIKASNTDPEDYFGGSVSLSEDGRTLAVGAYGEDSNATAIDGDQLDNTIGASGAAYVFTRDDTGQWSQQAYIKTSVTSSSKSFGRSVTLSAEGNTLAVGAPSENGSATGIDGEYTGAAVSAGATYVFTRDISGTWSQEAYIKASNTDANDFFGQSISLSADGGTLAVGAIREDSNATGIDGNQASGAAEDSGAVYVYARGDSGQWAQQAYVKASNPGVDDHFGTSVVLDEDGNTLAVGADQEDGSAGGIDGAQADDQAGSSGAVYLFGRDDAGQWSQHAYVKAPEPRSGDRFGASVTLSGDGNVLAIGARLDDGTANNSGAVYTFTRDAMGSWSPRNYVKAPHVGGVDNFGHSVALSADGNTLGVAAYREDSSATGVGGDPTSDATDGSGAVYLY